MFDKHKNVLQTIPYRSFLSGFSLITLSSKNNRNKYLVIVGCKMKKTTKKQLIQSFFHWLTVSPRSPAVPSAPGDPYQNDSWLFVNILIFPTLAFFFYE